MEEYLEEEVKRYGRILGGREGGGGGGEVGVEMGEIQNFKNIPLGHFRHSTSGRNDGNLKKSTSPYSHLSAKKQ